MKGLLCRDYRRRYAFFEIDGACYEKVSSAKVLKVDTGNVAAFEAGVGFEVETVKGFKNILFGGEGLFLTRLTGPAEYGCRL